MNAKISRLCQIQQTPRSKKRLATRFDRSSRSHCDTETLTVEAPAKHWRSWPPFVSAGSLRRRSASAISQSPFLASTNAPCFLAVRTLPLSSIPMRLAVSDRLLVGLASAIGAALGAQRMIGEPLLAFAAELVADALNRPAGTMPRSSMYLVEDRNGVPWRCPSLDRQSPSASLARCPHVRRRGGSRPLCCGSWSRQRRRCGRGASARSPAPPG